MKRILIFIKRYRLVLLFASVYTLVVLLVTLNRFWQYEAFYYDHGIYDMAIWKLSRFQAPTIEHLDVGGKLEIADHFNPSIFLLTPLYWLTDKQEIILIAQALLIGISILFAYLISAKLIKNKLMRFALLLSYVGFIGFQNALIANFHDVTFMVLPLMITMWAALNSKWTTYWIFLTITLGSRETAAAIGVGLGFYLLFKDKNSKKQGVLTIILSILYGLIVSRVLIPFFLGRPFLYQPILPKDTFSLFLSLFFPIIKLKTIAISLLTFGFLPLFYPPMYLAILQDYLIRFVFNTGSARWDLGLHYNVTLSPLFFVAAVEAVGKLEKYSLWKNILRVYAFILIIIVLGLHYFLHGPFGLAYNMEFYRHTGRQKFMDDFLNLIPKKGKIMAPNNIAVRLSHYDVILMRGEYEKYNPDIVVIDLREGQNANNYWPLQEWSVKLLRDKLKSDPTYTDIYNGPNRHIFVKKQ